MAELEKEFQFYIDHQLELVKKFNGRTLVIKECAVFAAYDSVEQAYFDAKSRLGLGTFIIQECTPGKLSYTHNYYSQNVAF